MVGLIISKNNINNEINEVKKLNNIIIRPVNTIFNHTNGGYTTHILNKKSMIKLITWLKKNGYVYNWQEVKPE